MVKKKKNVPLDETINVVKTGAVGMGGMMALGAMAPLAGPAAAPIVGIAGAGVGLATLGQALSSGGKIAKDLVPKRNKKYKAEKDIMDKFW